jgi:diguanylate cyclase (GGDEF)-like protein
MLQSWAGAHQRAKVGSTQTLSVATGSDPRLIHVLAGDEVAVEGPNRHLRASGWNVVLMSSRAQLEMSIATVTPVAVLVYGGVPDAVDMIRVARERLNPGVRVVYLSRADDLDLQFAAMHAGASGCLSADLASAELVERFYALMGIFHHEEARVLVVCDNDVRGRRYRRMLEAGGCQSRLLSEPGTVMAQLVDFRPELLLVDLANPELTNLEFGAVMRQHAAMSRLRFVYVQDQPLEADKRLVSLGAGGDDYVGRDMAADHLPRLVRSRIVGARRLVSLSAEDPLTGLLVRDAFQRQFELMLGMLTRSGGALAVAALEVDHLLEINEVHGHSAGDLVLRRVGTAFSKRLRSSDSLSRYVSGRFVMALPGADTDAAVRIVDEVRARLQATPVQLPGSERFITTSAGIAGFRFKSGHGEVPLYAAQLVESAGRALDRARAEGGGRSVVDSGG